MKINTAAIYTRSKEDKAYQIGAAAAFIIDHRLSLSGLYMDEDSLDAWKRLMTDCAKGGIDSIIVRDMSVITEEMEELFTLENLLPIPVIGAEDLYCTREDLNLETLQIEKPKKNLNSKHRESLRNSVAETVAGKQEEGIFVGRTPYGFSREEEHLITDPDTAKVVEQMFELARDGHRPSRIMKYLNEMEIPTPGGGKKWSRDSVKHILENRIYRGALIKENTFDQVQKVFVEKSSAKRAEEKESEPFPMARCDVCNSKLTYLKAGAVPRLKTSSYRCMKHTGKSPRELPLDQMPQISIDDMTAQVLAACNEFFLAADRVNAEDALIEIREKKEVLAARKIELGECILRRLGQAGKVFQPEIPKEAEQYSGLWSEWIKVAIMPIDIAAKVVYRTYSPLIFGSRQMKEYNPEIGRRIIKSLRLKADGSLTIRFWGDELIRQG